MTADSISNSDGSDELTTTGSSVTTTEARDRLRNALFSALKSGVDTLIDAPTSLGKTHLIATTCWRDYPEITGGKPVIHIHQTKEARKQARQLSEQAGVEYRVLRGRDDCCPVAAGKHDDEFTAPNGLAPSEWFEWMCDVRKANFANAHNQLHEARSLPCGKTCDAVTQWWDVSGGDDEPVCDVIHTTANFAHVDDLIDGANLIFDERPEYKLTFGNDQRAQFQKATTNLLKHRSDGRYTMLDLRFAAVRDDELAAELGRLFEDEVSDEWLFRREETHRLAPAIGRAILSAEPICADRYRGADGRTEVVITEDGVIRHVQHTPDLALARCVVGLDAFPSELRWQLNTVDTLERREILSPVERKTWRRTERGLKIKQVGDATRSYTRGWRGAGKERAGAVIRKLRQMHGAEFQSCIAADAIENEVERMMREAGIEDPKTMHYGEQKSRNDFTSELVGLLIGCIDPGDENLLDLLALAGLVAEPEMTTNADGEIVRKPDRGFTGPDADAAAEFLASVRENNLAQGAGRYARNPDDSDSGAVVYVWSDALPEALVDEKIGTSFSSVAGKRAGISELLKTSSSRMTTTEIKEMLGGDRSYIIECLDEMTAYGYVSKHPEEGYQGGHVWEWNGGCLKSTVSFDR